MFLSSNLQHSVAYCSLLSPVNRAYWFAYPVMSAKIDETPAEKCFLTFRKSFIYEPTERLNAREPQTPHKARSSVQETISQPGTGIVFLFRLLPALPRIHSLFHLFPTHTCSTSFTRNFVKVDKGSNWVCRHCLESAQAAMEMHQPSPSTR